MRCQWVPKRLLLGADRRCLLTVIRVAAAICCMSGSIPIDTIRLDESRSTQEHTRMRWTSACFVCVMLSPILAGCSGDGNPSQPTTISNVEAEGFRRPLVFESAPARDPSEFAISPEPPRADDVLVELFSSADAILTLRALRGAPRRTVNADGEKIIVTDYELESDRVLCGIAPARISVLGGTIDGDSYAVADAPELEVGVPGFATLELGHDAVAHLTFLSVVSSDGVIQVHDQRVPLAEAIELASTVRGGRCGE